MARSNRKIFRYLIPTFIILLYVGYAGVKVVYANEPIKETQQNVENVVADSSVNTAETSAEHKPAEEHKEAKLDAGKLIMEHIADAHDWHIATIGHNHISIPLPVIIKDASGLHVFSSSHLHEGEVYQGYKIEEGKIIAENGNDDFYDLSITKNVAAMFIAVFALLWIMLSIAGSYKRNGIVAPKGIQSFVEPLIFFIRDEVAIPSIGKKYEKYLPYLLTIFFFIFFNNIFGLIPFFPGGANVTGNISITMILALFTFAITSFSAKKEYWIHIINTPGVPWWLKFPVPLMPIVELIGVFSKPFVLMVRLFANITAGHIIMLGFFSLIFIFAEMNTGLGFGVSIFSVAFTTFMSFLELLVAFLQAYVFTLLSALYFGMAIEEHHSEEHH
ncbi:MAG: F0F1 ATP synthase subunit A [Bacteroidota bacterium]